MGGRRSRVALKDYTLLRDGLDEEELFGDAEAGRRRKASVWRLFGLAKKEVWILLLASVALAIGSLAVVAIPKLAGQLIDVCITYDKGGVSKRDAMHRLNNMLYEILGVLAIGGVASGFRSWLFNSAAERVMCRLRCTLFSRLMGQETGFFDRTRTGELMNRLSEDTRLMKSAGTVSISVALRSTVVATFGVVLMFVTSPLLTALTLAVLPVLLLTFKVYSNFNKRYTAQQLTASAQASTVAEECFGSIRTVRAFAKEGAACDKYEDAVQCVLQWGLASAFASGLFFAGNFILSTASVVLVLWFGARLVVEGKLTPGELSTFIIYAIYVGGEVGSIASVISSLVQAVGASERVFQLLDRAPQMVPAGKAKPSGSPDGGEVQFCNVHFSYPSRPDVQVLKGIHLHVRPGKKVALVGTSGGGKSTIVNLVERFYDPQRGEVYLDGLPLPSIDHEHLHQHVAIVSQEPILFAESILNNISFALPSHVKATQEQVIEAAKIANAHDFISSFPQGYHTTVGERGIRLSGGQKQRIAIARAILTRPRVLLLDEATSALDAESEAAVQEALDRIAVGRTVITIAHRLSTVQNADEGLVMENGTIVERGTHSELLAKGGAYVLLVRRQLAAGASHATSLSSLHSPEGPSGGSEVPEGNGGNGSPHAGSPGSAGPGDAGSTVERQEGNAAAGRAEPAPDSTGSLDSAGPGTGDGSAENQEPSGLEPSGQPVPTRQASPFAPASLLPGSNSSGSDIAVARSSSSEFKGRRGGSGRSPGRNRNRTPNINRQGTEATIDELMSQVVNIADPQRGRQPKNPE